MSMAEAYATFAARGIHCDPVIVSKITMRSGKLLEPPDANCKRVISKEVADGMNRLLGGVMKGCGTGTRARIPDIQNQAGKTGTINSNKAVWFNGYTPLIAGSAMIAIDPTKKIWKEGRRRSGVAGYNVPSTGVVLEGSGSGDAGMKIWQPAMTEAMSGKPDVEFKEPPTSMLEGKQIQVPNLEGLGFAAGKLKLEQLGFTVFTRQIYSDAPTGQFLGWSPGSGASVPEFSEIYGLFSAGRDPAQVKAEQEAEARAREEQQQAEEQQRQLEEQQKQLEEQRKKFEEQQKELEEQLRDRKGRGGG